MFVDNDTTFCGSNNILEFFSFYVLDDISKPYHKYFQCVTQQLYNDPKEVFSTGSDLFKDIGAVETARDCLNKCKKDNYDLAFISTTKEE